jgi:hypothetical protein
VRIGLPRPRTDDDLAGPEMLAAKHLLLRHLELDDTVAERVSA